MDVLNEFLKTKGLYTLVMILFFLGVYGMVLSKNYMKKLMAMNVMQVAVIYFYLCFAQKDGDTKDEHRAEATGVSELGGGASED